MEVEEKDSNKVLVFPFYHLRHKFKGKECGRAQRQRSSASFCVQTKRNSHPHPRVLSSPVQGSLIKKAWCMTCFGPRERLDLASLSALVVHGCLRPGWEFF